MWIKNENAFRTRRDRSYANNQPFYYRVLKRLPLTKALIVSIILMLILLVISELKHFTETESNVLVISLRNEIHEKKKSSTKVDELDSETNRWKNTSLLMTVQVHGRIGNMMFAFASMLGIARRASRVPVISREHLLRSLFKVTTRPLDVKSIKDWSKLREEYACTYDPKLENVREPNVDMIELYGYLQSWRYFDDAKDEIRAEFTFHDFVIDLASRFIESTIHETFGVRTKRSDVTLIGVHVRRGDMTSDDSVRHGYTTATGDYVTRAMEYFERRHNRSRTLFVVCSDDYSWCNENIKSSSSSMIIVRPEHVADTTHLAILASCDHTVMTVGSFGWWGAWLAGGDTVYYKDFPRPNSPLSMVFNKQDYFYPGWIGM